ncbi:MULTISPECIES: SDR family oxidoreductase [unclassified Pseudofrankia]|uniref:SDR family oxidoreductase n=1 Tax=unclassified Pseudofrankia TaxID=2994372 RepID=UPI0008DA1EEC|nr:MULTISPECIES: SDR family oxidoreductase [unclassified Pseudofrankia]MDT3439927.1 SDR family oxidoreductase [Pseudofrankia sp. BMG5.37]OHV48393.1 short-chain dehydrogenase [Pseudofrankia sp. BMG5.36]
MRLNDKVVVITGAGGGIGEACAHRFAAEGAKVVVTDINPAGVERVSNAIGGVGLATDITVEENVRAVANLARRTYGEIDIWFSNAGVAGPSQPGEIQENFLWEAAWRLHVLAHVYAAREVLPAMLERGDGYLLQTASIVALSAHPEKVTYSVTKHAALAFSEWLAMTYRGRGIKVSCFCPGAMLTPMLLNDEFPEDHPVLRTALKPDEVADRLVQAIDREKFLIVDSPWGPEALMAKATDFDGWLDQAAAPFR